METQRPSRHQRRREQTRRQLIQAAVQLVLEKGYDTISIQDITDRADLGRGTFYIHFKDKEDIIWSAIQDGLKQTEAQVHYQYRDSIPEQPEYYGYLNILRHVDQHRDLYRVMLGSQGSAMLTARVQVHLAQEYEHDISTIPQKMYAEFELPQPVLVQIVSGAVIQLVRWWLETPNEYTPEQLAVMLYEGLHHKKAPGGNPRAL